MTISNEAFRVTKDKADKMRGLLMSASRYVQGYAENENNHPQARDGARTLLAEINSTLK